MKMLIILVMVATLMFAGCTGSNTAENKTDSAMEVKNKTGTVMENKTGNAMQNKSDTNKSGTAMENEANFAPFTKAAYLDAVTEHKVVFLEFYANWCPTCAAQAPEIEAAFKELKNPNVVGFQVNYKDSDTDSDEQDLAREFGITYQHTHVILDSEGNVAKKSTGETWSKDTILSEISKVA